MSNRIGKKTTGGWTIVEPVIFASDHTGGYFSECFYVERGSEKAFLKLLDISNIVDFGELLQGLSEFKYETQIVQLSTDRRLSRVVRLVESGELEVDPSNPIPILRTLPYLVFERGEGDIRETVDVSKIVSDKWRFCILHRAASGLLQLHQANIAHQDLKPSNVLRFADEQLKIGDLGRSTLRGNSAPHDSLGIPGALSYAPFELQYSFVLADWIQRRLATDVFHVGCLMVYVFTNIVLPAHVFDRLDPVYKPSAWGDPYPQVVPHIKAALEKSLAEMAEDFPLAFREDMISMVRDMCNPDPEKRGTGSGPRSDAGTSLWLQKFVSRFDIMEKRAGLAARKQNA